MCSLLIGVPLARGGGAQDGVRMVTLSLERSGVGLLLGVSGVYDDTVLIVGAGGMTWLVSVHRTTLVRAIASRTDFFLCFSNHRRATHC